MDKEYELAIYTYQVRIEELEQQLKIVKDFAQLMQHLAEED